MKVDDLHSVYLNEEISDIAQLPERIAFNIRSFQLCYPQARHQLFGIESGRAFLQEHFGAESVAAFDTLVPLSYKADLLRYAALHVNGGVYADLSVLIHAQPGGHRKDADMLVMRDQINQAPWIVNTSIIFARPRLGVFLRCVEQILHHVRIGYYGANPLCVTGPNMFGKLLAAHADLSRLACGETLSMNRNGGSANAYRDLNGDVFATNIKRGRGLTSLGAGKHDDYNEHYRRRGIYAHDAGTRALQTLKNVKARIWAPGRE